jgi:hypothetical protein
MRPLGDRRAHVRLEVVGTLWGTLEITEPAAVVNISDSGVLVATRVAPAVHALQPIDLRIGGEELRLDARVRHFQPRQGADGQPEYLVGLEFVREKDPATTSPE